jgi:hypothetical protein
MITLSASAENYIEQLRELQALLTAREAAVIELRYTMLLMGSFSLVAGTAHRRLKFDWDGREFFLNIQTCSCQSQSSAQDWLQIDNVRIPPPQSVWPTILDRCGHAFGA